MDFADPPNDDKKPDMVDLSVRGGNQFPGCGFKVPAIGTPATVTPRPKNEGDTDDCDSPSTEPETGG